MFSQKAQTKKQEVVQLRLFFSNRKLNHYKLKNKSLRKTVTMQSGKAMLLPPYNSFSFHDPKMILELCTSDDKPCIFHKTNKM